MIDCIECTQCIYFVLKLAHASIDTAIPLFHLMTLTPHALANAMVPENDKLQALYLREELTV